MLAGCGGGGGSAPSPAAPARTGLGTANVTVRVDVPLTGTASLRRPAYVSPATQSLAVAVLTTPGNALAGTFSVNVTPASTACQTVTVNGVPTLTCTLSVPLSLPASGTYELATTTYDQAQTQQCSPSGTPLCTGHILSASLMAATLQVNATNVVSIALGGLANGFTVTPVTTGFVQGNVTGLHIYGPQAQTLVVTPLDADGYTIVGAGAPMVALSSSSPSALVTTTSPGVFAIAATTSGGVVTPGTVPLTLAATPVDSPASPFSLSVPLTISHTALFVSDGGNVSFFLDGNTTANGTLMTMSGPRGIAVDANGTVYVSNHGNNTVSECPAPSYATSCTAPIVGVSAPEGAAIDASGNLWVSASGNSTAVEYLAGQTTPNLTLPTSMPTERGISLDASGNLWVADQTNFVDGFSPPITNLSSVSASLTSGLSTTIGIANDATGNLWVANSTGLVDEFAVPIATGNTPTTPASLSDYTDVAIDAGGTLWASNNVGSFVEECPPPIGVAACSSITTGTPLWLAVNPAAIDP